MSKLEVRCQKYTFDEKRHKHYINGHEVTGTTTITGVIDKPSLIPWAITTTVNELKKQLKKHDFDTAAEHAKQEPNRKKKEAATFGTLVHALCEHFNKTGVLLSEDSPLLPQAEISPKEKVNQRAREKAHSLAKEYTDFLEKNNAKILYVEQNVFSETYFVGGIFDIILEMDGKTYICDIKTSSGVYPSHFVQMGGYHVQLDEMIERGYVDDIQIDGYMVIHLPRKGKLSIHKQLNTDIFKRAFRACLYIYRVINEQLWAL